MRVRLFLSTVRNYIPISTRPKSKSQFTAEAYDPLGDSTNRYLPVGSKGAIGPKGDKGDVGPKGDKGDKRPKVDKGDVVPLVRLAVSDQRD